MQEININALGERLATSFANASKVSAKISSVVGEVRGLGAMLAFDVIKDGDDTIPNAELTKKIIDTCVERGLVVISAV